MEKGYHTWPDNPNPHPVGQKHEKAPKGSKHWQKSEWQIANTKYKEGK